MITAYTLLYQARNSATLSRIGRYLNAPLTSETCGPYIPVLLLPATNTHADCQNAIALSVSSQSDRAVLLCRSDQESRGLTCFPSRAFKAVITAYTLLYQARNRRHVKSNWQIS